MWNDYVLDKTLKLKCPEILQLIPNVFIFQFLEAFHHLIFWHLIFYC